MNESTVIVIRSKGSIGESGELSLSKIRLMIERGIQLLTGAQDARDGFGLLFSQNDRVGIKINTIGGRKISTRPELSLSLADQLVRSGLQEKNIIIWDRTNRELREAGYSLTTGSTGLKIFATDTDGAGYDEEITSHLNIGSLFSTIQSNFVTASISLAILKDHGLAGITAGMKNYFGAIHNPNKYHDTSCNPYVAELFETSFVKDKHRLTILDGLVVQYHRGPSFHAQWVEPCAMLVFSRDAVAADAVGWRVIESLRAKKGLPGLEEDKRKPAYLETAERMGLGFAVPEKIKWIEDEV